MAFSTRALEHAPTLPEGMTAAPEEVDEDEAEEEEKEKEAIAAAEAEKQAEEVEKKASSSSKKATATRRKSPSREQQLAAEALLRRQMEEEAAAAASTQDIFVPGMNARGLRLGRFAAPEESGSMQEGGAPAPNAVDRYGLRSPSMSGKLPMDLDGRINKKSR